MVEMALVAPLLLMLSLGAAEVGVAWQNTTGVVQASATGARTVTQIGPELEADRLALRSIRAGLDDDWSRVQRVVVYRATAGGDGRPPAACVASGVTVGPAGANCNVYDGADLADVDNPARFHTGTGCGGGRSSSWCPTGRNNSLRNAEYVGVWIEYENDWITGALPFVGSYTVEQYTVLRMEPRL